MGFFSTTADTQAEQTITQLRQQIAEQQQIIESMKETIAAEMMQQSRFLGNIVSGPAAELIDMVLTFVLAIGFTYLAMWVMTKFTFVQQVNVPYHDELDDLVNEYKEKKTIEQSKATFAQALSINNSARVIGGLFVLASMYAYLS